ncbi:MAG: hypothetical protein OEM02_17295 [Desulfobulbaceae bacterium]|nr:hypothetical protein [Desulfobulbaceae bacterium]
MELKNITYNIRCPHCLEEIKVPKTTPLFQKIPCTACDGVFEFRNALPSLERKRTTKKLDVSPYSLPSRETSTHTTLVPFIITLSIALVLTIWLCSYSNKLDGISFLVLYFFLFFALLITSFLLRLVLGKTLIIQFLTIGLFEFIGSYRLYWGHTHEMHNFGALYVSMFFGGLLLLAVQTITNGYGSGNSNGCSGGCSGCSGGCGCGGCSG